MKCPINCVCLTLQFLVKSDEAGMPGSCARIVAVAWLGKDENTAGFLLCSWDLPSRARSNFYLFD